MASRHQQEKKSSWAQALPSRHRAQHTTMSVVTRKSHQPPVDATLLPWHGLWRLRSHVALDWDAQEQKVVPKRNQVAASWRHLFPHSFWGNHKRFAVADVIEVPPELFQLKDLKDVLTLEAWKGCLSSSERQLLKELLPKGADHESLVRSILDGDIFHFGNPLADWGEQLLKGELHPDSVQQREFDLKHTHKDYYLEVQRYHEKMLETLGVLKELWVSCKSTEKELNPKIKRWMKIKSTRKELVNAQSNSFLSQQNKVRSPCRRRIGLDGPRVASDHINEENALWQKCKRRKIGSLQEADILPAEDSKRIKPKIYNCINVDSCAQIMHTLKVNRKQYADIMHLKAKGEELLLTALNPILGDQQKIEVHHINGCDNKDTLKIHKFWSMLAEKDIPDAHAVFFERKLEKQRLAKSAAEQCMQHYSVFICKEDKLEFDKHSNTISSSGRGKHTVECQASIIAKIGKQKQLSTSESSVTCLEEQARIQATVDSCVSSADIKNPSSQYTILEEQISLIEMPGGSSQVGEDHTSILASVQAGRVTCSIKEGNGFSVQGRSGTHNGAVMPSETDIISEDDEVSVIKNIWSNDDLDTQELHSHDGGMPAVNKHYFFLGIRKDPIVMDSHSKPGSEVTRAAAGSAESEEVEQRVSFQAGGNCNGLDLNLLDLQVKPAFQNDPQLFNFSGHSSLFSHQEPVENGQLFYSSHASNMESFEDKQDQVDHHQGKHHKVNAGDRFRIPVLAADKFSQSNNSHSKGYTQVLQMESNQFDHEQNNQLMLHSFLDQKFQSGRFLSADASSSHSYAPSLPEKNSICGINQTLSLTSQNAGDPPKKQEPVTELSLLMDNRSAEPFGHSEQEESVSSRTQTEFCENELEQNQMIRHTKQQMQAGTAPFFSSGKGEGGRLSNFFPNWDQLSQSPCIMDNWSSKHGQYKNIPRTFSGGTFLSMQDGQGSQGIEVWPPVQTQSLNHHSYTWAGERSGTITPQPWKNTSMRSHISPQYEQLTLQESCLSKINASWH